MERDTEIDTALRLERYYRNTWLCSACGRRNQISENVCPKCMDRALEDDAAKLDALSR